MLSLYVHIPFCVSKCRYCGFYSTRHDRASVDRYLEDLQIELAQRAVLFAQRSFSSIYVGGGTPTVLSEKQISRLFTAINDRISATADAEVTVEGNPNTVSIQKLSCLRKQGVTRLSLGVQSFSDANLAVLGRGHTAVQAVDAVEQARNAGFDNVGIDLIFGIPGQSEQQWRETLESAIALRPEHISTYSLSADDGSGLAREVCAGTISLPEDDNVAGMYEVACERLRDAGYHHYEISNFALAGRQCRHNVRYWERGEYLGLGPGAWSFLGNRRSANVADIAEYSIRLRQGASTVEEEEILDQDQAAWETLFLALRTSSGFDLDRYGMLAGQRALALLRARIRELDRTGLVRIENGRLSLTDKGALLSNEVIARILP